MIAFSDIGDVRCSEQERLRKGHRITHIGMPMTSLFGTRCMSSGVLGHASRREDELPFAPDIIFDFRNEQI